MSWLFSREWQSEMRDMFARENMKLTPDQITAIAVVRAANRSKSMEAFAGWCRFYGGAGAPLTPHQQGLLEEGTSSNDPVANRLHRLRTQPAVHAVVQAFASARTSSFTAWGHTLLGGAPDDLAGQCALLYMLSQHPDVTSFTTLAHTFSVPLQELGERLMMGELMCSADHELERLARATVSNLGYRNDNGTRES